MSAALDIASWVLIVAGSFFFVTGMLGLVRMPDVFTRMHSVSVAETMGAGLLIAGMLLQSPDWGVAFRLILILLLIGLTSPVTSHAVAHAALRDGVKPLLARGPGGALVETEPDLVAPGLGVRMNLPLVSEQVEEAPPPEIENEIGEDDRR